MRDLIDIMDLSTEEIQELIVLAGDIIARPERYQEVCRHYPHPPVLRGGHAGPGRQRAGLL